MRALKRPQVFVRFGFVAAGARWLVVFLFASFLVLPGAQGQADPRRYRVEQVVRLETTTAEPQPQEGLLRTEPTTTSVVGRVSFVLEEGAGENPPGETQWLFSEVTTESPRTEPPEAANAGVERVMALGLEWMRRLDGQQFAGPVSELPVFPLGEAAPGWLTAWLRWAQTGGFSGVEANPVALPEVETNGESNPGGYAVRWLRSDFRQVPCHVQQARWVAPVKEAPESVPASLASEGVEAQTHFAAQSLEWVAQDSPVLIYAERSGVRETFWNLEKVKRPELRQLVFRLRLAVQVRVERLP